MGSPHFTSICAIAIILFFHIPKPTCGRTTPLESPSSSPPVASSAIASPPLVMQMVIVYQHHHMDKEVIMAITLSSVAVALVIVSILLACIFWQRNRNDKKSNNSQHSESVKDVAIGPISTNFNSLKMMGNKKGSLAMVEYLLLEASTSNFSENNILGEGGSGFVYKACFDGGVLAAVKKIEVSGRDIVREFENEIDLLGAVQHQNIISLLGFCVHEDKRFLVYELMQNGSLETQLHGPSHGAALTWHLRMKIALDIARGLEYLHENCSPPVIHRDLKSSNILLDSEFNAKISDFGLAVTNQSKSSIKLSGTLGYVAPEYLLDGKLTEKSDVYAFGVILLELLIGREPVEKLSPSQCQTIVTWAMPQLTDRSKLPNMVDPVIRNTMDLKHLYQVAAVAVLCVQPEPSYRPLITDVLHSLVPLIPTELGGTLRMQNY